MLYLTYRSEKEIKATSPFLSLNIFFAVFLALTGFLIDIAGHSFAITNGTLGIALCTVKSLAAHLSMNFSFATLLVRMLRIYYFFNHFGTVSRMWSDWVLFGVILAINSFTILLGVTWVFIDPHHIVEHGVFVSAAKPPYYSIVQECKSDFFLIWAGLVYAEIAVVIIIVVILAIKTRKIKRSDFKDTKKVMAYVFIVTILICLLSLLLWILVAVGRLYDAFIARIVRGIVYVILTQQLLFVPKVLPALLRHIRASLSCNIKIKEQRKRLFK